MPPTTQHGGGHGRGLPRSLLSGTLLSHGVSSVARASDRGRVPEVYNQFRNVSEFSIRVSPSHSYNADRAGLGWGVGWP
jgi:hypothetical protein